MTTPLYRVLVDGLVQVETAGTTRAAVDRERSFSDRVIRRVAVDEEITLSELAAARLVAEGFVTPVPAPAPATMDEATDLGDVEDATNDRSRSTERRCPDHPKYRGKSDPREDCVHCTQVFEAAQAEEL